MVEKNNEDSDKNSQNQVINERSTAPSPSVVYINTGQQVINPWTRDVYSITRGTGSGFMWDKLGHIVTNQHVIENSSEAIVYLTDGRSYRAVLIGDSASHDLAVLRISISFNVPPPVPTGSSHDLKVGHILS